MSRLELFGVTAWAGPPGAPCPPSPLKGSRPHFQAPGGSATGPRLTETPSSEPAAEAPGTAPRSCLLSQPPPAWRAPLLVLLLGTLPGRVSSVIGDREGSGDASSGFQLPVFQLGGPGEAHVVKGEQRPGWALEASARSLRWLPPARATCGWMEPPCFPEGGPKPPRAPPPPRGRL